VNDVGFRWGNLIGRRSTAVAGHATHKRSGRS
jgi:hypothetical protein